MIRALGPDDAAAFAALRREALEREPIAFGSSLATDRFLDPLPVRAYLAGEGAGLVLGALEGAALVGCVGLHRPPQEKRAHRVVLWGTYLSAAARGRGLGRALLVAAVERARSLSGVRWVDLEVTASAAPARRLYESVGFVAWGTQPDGLRHGGSTADVVHMTLDLGGAGKDLAAGAGPTAGDRP